MFLSLLVLLVNLGFIFIESVGRTTNPSTPIQQQKMPFIQNLS